MDAAASSQPSSDPSSSSNSCPAGKYYGETYSGSEMQHTAVGCIECAAGQYSDAPGQAGCIDCVANTYLDATGSDEASDCIACPDNGVTRSRARDPDGNMAGTIYNKLRAMSDPCRRSLSLYGLALQLSIAL